jgi:hypothetical protein
MKTKLKKSTVASRVIRALKNAERWSKGEIVPGVRVAQFPQWTSAKSEPD